MSFLRDYQDTTESKKVSSVSCSPVTTKPILNEDTQYSIASTKSNQDNSLLVVPRLSLPSKNINQSPTLLLFNTIRVDTHSSLYAVDTIPIDQQVTRIIPAIQQLANVPKTATQLSGAESYISIIRNLVKNSGIYTLSSLASPLITLLLAPFLTHNLSRAEFGALAVLNTLIALVAGITQLGLNAAFFRVYSFDYESKKGQLGVLSTTVALLSLTSIIIAIIAMVADSWLASLILNSSSFNDSIRLAVLVIIMQNLTVPGLSWLRAEQRAGLYSLLSIINLLVTAGTTIVLVGILHMGIAGSLIAMSIGYAVVVVCTLPAILLCAGIRIRIDIAWAMLTFGLPHLANLLSSWVLQLSDRYLLGRLGSLSQAASYAVAYSLGGILSPVVITSFSLAWWSIMYTIAKREDAARVFGFVFRWFSLVLLFATFGLSLFGVVVLEMFFPPTYHSTAFVIPIVALSTMFYGVYVVVALGVSLKRKTWITSICITFSAVLNVILNLLLIPSYGALGAALATLIAYISLTVISYIVNQRLYPVPFEIGRFLTALLIGLALYAGSNSLAQRQTIYIAWVIHICALVLYGGLLLVFGILPYQGRNKIHS